MKAKLIQAGYIMVILMVVGAVCTMAQPDKKVDLKPVNKSDTLKTK